MLSFFPRGVLDEILNLIESVSKGFPSYSFLVLILGSFKARGKKQMKNARRKKNYYFSQRFVEKEKGKWSTLYAVVFLVFCLFQYYLVLILKLTNSTIEIIV